MDAVELISGLLAKGALDLEPLKDVVKALYFGVAPYTGIGPCSAPPTILPPPVPPTNSCQAVATIYYALYATPAEKPQLGGLQNQADKAAKALKDVYTAVDTDLIPGVSGIQKVLYNTPCDQKAAPGTPTACGYAQALTLVRDGIPQLVSALTASIKQTLLAGIGTSPAAKGCDPTKSLTCASAALTAGSAALASGASQVADGTETLAAGTKTLNAKVPDPGQWCRAA